MTPRTAAMATSVVTPEITIIHRTLAMKPAAAGSRGLSSASGSLMEGHRQGIVIAAAETGERLDRVLAARIADLSRSRLKALILAGEVAIGGRTIRDPGHRVNAGDAVSVVVPSPEPAAPLAEAMPLNVVYEDDAIIVIDKPAGLVVHPAPAIGPARSSMRSSRTAAKACPASAACAGLALCIASTRIRPASWWSPRPTARTSRSPPSSPTTGEPAGSGAAISLSCGVRRTGPRALSIAPSIGTPA